MSSTVEVADPASVESGRDLTDGSVETTAMVMGTVTDTGMATADPTMVIIGTMDVEAGITGTVVGITVRTVGLAAATTEEELGVAMPLTIPAMVTAAVLGEQVVGSSSLCTEAILGHEAQVASPFVVQ